MYPICLNYNTKEKEFLKKHTLYMASCCTLTTPWESTVILPQYNSRLTHASVDLQARTLTHWGSLSFHPLCCSGSVCVTQAGDSGKGGLNPRRASLNSVCLPELWASISTSLTWGYAWCLPPGLKWRLSDTHDGGEPQTWPHGKCSVKWKSYPRGPARACGAGHRALCRVFWAHQTQPSSGA